uniref:DNA primase n=1 Tax=Acrobeloides nanus TaxID=290746 RepID=A0A914EH03_9BILA
MFEWLSYGLKPQDYIFRREFAFIFEDDAYLRYQSFKNEHEFRTQLSKSQPFKIDIGAVFNHEPRDHKKFTDFRAQERELVFDIDLTDYDIIRNCCEGANMCSKCWRWIPIAVKVLDFLLREHFGFKHLLWVFSGRRGIHCWVSDEVARKLNNEGRMAVAEYLSLISGENKIGVGRKNEPLHAMIEDAYDTIVSLDDFEKLVIEQGWFENESKWEPILKICDDLQTRDEINAQFSAINDDDAKGSLSLKRWRILKRRFDEKFRAKLEKSGEKLLPPPVPECKNFLKAFVLLYAYPRLDVNVSTGINHLLKSPFCIHPSTGNVAVPVNPKTIERFKISDVPRVDKLVTELKKVVKSSEDTDKENRKILYYKHTSLNHYIELFEAFVKNLRED